MRRLFAVMAAIALLCVSVSAQANITIDTVAVGNAGNAADAYAHSGNPAGQGSVAYSYNIAKYEVTAGQYKDFLNAVAGTDTYGLYNTSMTGTLGCNIVRSGSSGSYSYSVASDWANRPVNYVSYWDACRFANWLGNGQGSGSTETGAYTLDGYTGRDGRTIQRSAGATWAVTSEDEWYKAAYYKGGIYSLYANGTNTAPVAGTACNYNSAVGHTWDGSSNGALEQNGTKDMNGNVWEWNEAIVYQGSDYAYRGLRGGFLMINDRSLQSSSRGSNYPTSEAASIGFRVSRVPEPSSLVALLGGLAGLIGLRRLKV